MPRLAALTLRTCASTGALLLLACHDGAAGRETASAATSATNGPVSVASSGMSLGTGETRDGGVPTTGTGGGASDTGASAGATSTGASAGTSTGAVDPRTGEPTGPGTSTGADGTTTTDPTGPQGPSCGPLVGTLGWGDDALCEQNGDGICKGTGEPTWDHELCCHASAIPSQGGFGYPVGDLTSSPAGGWSIGQVMAHYRGPDRRRLGQRPPAPRGPPQGAVRRVGRGRRRADLPLRRGRAQRCVRLDSEPYSYQPIADICGDSNDGDVLISPTKFIEAHHF